jgi:cytochrome c oxidase cbb3-type subunit III
MGMQPGLRRAVVAFATMLALAGCNREHRPLQPKPAAETGPRGLTLTQLYAGQPAPMPSDPRAKEYQGNALHISNGQTYYQWFNCSGCHFNGGGGIGPPLMDAEWRYGGEIEQIYATIVQGRPNGMPSFKDKIPEAQVWEIAAFVKSLSGDVDRLAAPSRADKIRSTGPINNMNRQEPKQGDPAAATAGTSR